MPSAILALKHKYLNRSYRKSAVHAVAIPWKTVYVGALIVTFMMLMLYVYRVNQLTQGAYLIKNYSNQVASLTVQNSNLQSNFQQTSFLSGVAQKAQELGFEKTGTLSYVQVVGGSLAEAR